MATAQRDSSTSAAEQQAPLVVGGLLSALGALGLATANLFYAMSPMAGAAPMQPFDLGVAMSGVVAGASTLQAAGTVGIFGDLIWATASLVVAQELGRRGKGLAAAGWNALLVAIVLFIFVDGMTGFVLPPLASAHNAQAFEGFRHFWDALFLLCAFAFGIATVTIVASELREVRPHLGRAYAGVMLLVALIGSLCAVAGFAGIHIAHLPTNEVAGGSIGVGAVLYIAFSLRIASRARLAASHKT